MIVEGNYYGVMGGKHNESETYMYNSYRASGNYTVDIEGTPTELIKLAYLASLAAGPAPSGSFGADPGLNIGRIHLITAPIPEPVCPEPIVVDNDPGICGAVVNYPIPTADGATVTQIDASGLSSGDEFAVGSTIQQFEFDFGGGDLDTCTFNVIVNDTEPPVFTCPEDITVNAASGETCVEVNFPVLNTDISEGEPGIILTDAPTNQAGVAYNPDKKLYYAVQAGSPNYTLYTYDETGTQVSANT